MRSKNYPGLFSLFFCLAVLLTINVSYVGADEESGKKEVLAIIGDQKITIKDMTDKIEKLPPELKLMYETEQGKEHLLREMVRIEVFSREAQSIGLDKDKNFLDRISKIKKALLSRAYIKQKILSRANVSDKEAENYYKEHLDEFKSPEKIKAPFILIKISADASPEAIKEKERLAKEILKRINKGEDILRLSKEFSEDIFKVNPLDYFSRGRLVPEIEEDVFRLKIGEISPILKLGDGLIIFKLEDRIPERQMSFKEVKEEIIEELRKGKQEKEFEAMEEKLFSKYKVAFTKGSNLSIAKNEKSIDIRGKITKIITAVNVQENGLIGKIIIESNKEESTKFDRASVKVTGSSSIFKQHGKEMLSATFDDLKIGQLVEVQFIGPVLQSYPVQAEAKEIVILQPVSK